MFETLINHNVLLVYLLIYVYYIWQGVYFYFFKKIRSVKYHALGWSVFWIASVLYVLNDRNIITLANTAIIYDYAMLFQMFMFAVALSEKMNNITKTKELNNQKLIELQNSQKEILQDEVKAKTKEIQLRLNERESLLQELNHRVKNNMQIIISLLRMQAQKYGDKEKEIVQTAENRIRSMLYVHELLYSKNDNTNLNTKEYLKTLIDQLIVSYDIKIEDIKIDIQEIDISTHELTLIGFILNELLTNAIKHAKAKDTLLIDIKLYYLEDKIHLELKDNGQEFSESIDGLGNLFIDAIVTDQLKGKIDRFFKDGYHIKVQI